MLNKKTVFTFLLLFVLLFLVFGFFLYKNKTFTKKSIVPSIKVLEDDLVQNFPLKEVSLSTDANVYSSGNEIKAVAIIRNSFFEKKDWKAVCYLVSDDEFVFSSIGQIRELKLSPGETERIEFIFKVEENLSPGNYKIRLDVLDNEELINSSLKIVAIEGTLRKINANLKFCSDADCFNEKAVFNQDESIYVRLNSNILKLNIKGKIKYPESGDWQDLNFEKNLSVVRADKIGAYEILVDISEDGYMNESIKRNFAVIESVPMIKNASKCNVNGKCDDQENSQNCPQDCPL